ncbi:S41 family peptidase [uncultured Streptomyces sp.]|uniref:S41 family peptidase n=1 Tax=uncultured Streptomyces sp. TaxID=174707 RepID=UPI002622F3DA|nr:S41 family peptidase [uncultured Streptomyces sp.]
MDLRSNYGGNMWGPLAAVGAVLGDGEVGSFVAADGTRIPWTMKNGTPRDYLDDWGPAEPLARPMPPVAVLTGRTTGSAAEAVALAFRGRPVTRSFGVPTAGLATANVVHPLPDGAVIVLTQRWEADRTGRVQKGPLTPDTEVHDDARDTSRPGDQVLTAATRWLAAQSACRA